jgi:uncharacterized DUF497 family protein
MTLFEWNDAKANANLRKHGVSLVLYLMILALSCAKTW